MESDSSSLSSSVGSSFTGFLATGFVVLFATAASFSAGFVFAPAFPALALAADFEVDSTSS